MIRIITDKSAFGQLSYTDIYEAKINVLYITYGLNCGFCSFYEMAAENGKRHLLISRLGRDYVIKEYTEDFDSEELAAFLNMNGAFGVFLSSAVLKKIESRVSSEYLYNNLMEYGGSADYRSSGLLNREPKLDDVYEILRHDFKLSHELWLTDISHRVRHGISKVFLYNGVSTATVLYDKDSIVFITQVATKEEARGKGNASSLLKEMASLPEYRDKRVVLVCRDAKLNFYQNTGFFRIGEAAQIYGTEK